MGLGIVDDLADLGSRARASARAAKRLRPFRAQTLPRVPSRILLIL